MYSLDNTRSCTANSMGEIMTISYKQMFIAREIMIISYKQVFIALEIMIISCKQVFIYIKNIPVILSLLYSNSILVLCPAMLYYDLY